VPGTRWSYSGGGYTVMQQLMIDRTGQRFPEFMQRTVLGPAGMRSSSYEQPPTGSRVALTAAGYYNDRRPVHGRWHVYPEMAAAGLWTTPTDLARFAIELQASHAGRSHRVITPAMARQMLTVQMNDDGLGVFLRGQDTTLQFGHNGRDEGFDALLVGWASTGQGAAIMINTNDNSGMIGRIQTFLSRQYHWPDQPAGPPPAIHAAPVSHGLLDSLEGRFELHNNDMITFIAEDSVLSTLADGFPDDIYFPAAGGGFVSSDGMTSFTVQRGTNGAVVGLSWRENGKERPVPRIGPLMAALPAMPDPDPTVTAKVARALPAMNQGGEALASSPDITEGARHDFAGGFGNTFTGLGEVSFISMQDVAGRGIERHGSPVARIGYYRVATAGGERLVLVHFTDDGLVTDIDVVGR